jgi:hypothetical protein
MPSSWTFLNAPSKVSLSQGRVAFTTHPNTDYWHPPDRTAANGHFYCTTLSLPKEYGLHLQSTLQGSWKAMYDQGGIMIRASAEKWIKAGIEYVDGEAYLRYTPHTLLTCERTLCCTDRLLMVVPW